MEGCFSLLSIQILWEGWTCKPYAISDGSCLPSSTFCPSRGASVFVVGFFAPPSLIFQWAVYTGEVYFAAITRATKICWHDRKRQHSFKFVRAVLQSKRGNFLCVEGGQMFRCSFMFVARLSCSSDTTLPFVLALFDTTWRQESSSVSFLPLTCTFHMLYSYASLLRVPFYLLTCAGCVIRCCTHSFKVFFFFFVQCGVYHISGRELDDAFPVCQLGFFLGSLQISTVSCSMYQTQMETRPSWMYEKLWENEQRDRNGNVGWTDGWDLGLRWWTIFGEGGEYSMETELLLQIGKGTSQRKFTDNESVSRGSAGPPRWALAF